MEIEDLPKIGKATADKIRDAGYYRVEDLAKANVNEISNISGIGEDKASQVIEKAREESNVGGFKKATEFDTRKKVSTLVPSLDEILGGQIVDKEEGEVDGGGIPIESITEMFGEFGTGKSQIAIQLCVSVQLPEEHGGLGKGAVFLDTEDTFRPERVKDVVGGLNDEQKDALKDQYDVESDEDLEEAVLNNIHVAKIYDAKHQVLMGEEVRSKVASLENDEDSIGVGLIVLDSLIAQFRSEYTGRGDLAERQQMISKHLGHLEQAGDQIGAAVVITNQVQSDPGTMFGDPTKPVGGHVVGHRSSYRLYLQKAKNDTRRVKIYDAPDLGERETVVDITDDGVEDANDEFT